MFNQGDIVKSKNRTEGCPLVLMVLDDIEPSPTQFNAVVLHDESEEHEKGYVANNWNTSRFEVVNEWTLK